MLQCKQIPRLHDVVTAMRRANGGRVHAPANGLSVLGNIKLATEKLRDSESITPAHIKVLARSQQQRDAGASSNYLCGQ